MRTKYSDECDEIMKHTRFSVADPTSLALLKQFAEINQLREKKSAKQTQKLEQLERSIIARLTL